MTRLEISLNETNGYLQRILTILQKGREVVELPRPRSVLQKPPIPPEGYWPPNLFLQETMTRKHVSLLRTLAYMFSDRANQTFIPRPKIELQFFDGDDPRSWIRKCDNFFPYLLFRLYNAKEPHNLAGALQPFMLQLNASFGEAYFISSFISGLKDNSATKSNNLCFKCGDKFGPSHQCKPKQLNMMEELDNSQDLPDPEINELKQSLDTHNFVTEGWTKVGLELIQTHPLSITVANGGSDMVLGVDWMRKYNLITMDFNKMTLTFSKADQCITLYGGLSQASLNIISGDKMQKLTSKDPNLVGELYFLSVDTIASATPECLHPLLEKFKSVFDEPQGLPPPQVEKQISAMLSASIIQNSKNPFASPCLLIKKKDGTWFLCADYRQLSSLTVKNKYHIPVVDDLLDELSVARYYSKLDLRSRY
ncbi:hypothetical protein GQ457_03G021820 [Hibiscus cannabinus]